MPETLVVRNYLGIEGATSKVECPSSRITILVDEDGNRMREYVRALSHSDSKEVGVEYAGTKFAPNQHSLVGFVDKLPDGLTLAQYLVEGGYDQEEVPDLLEDYDLRRVSYLFCAQIPATAMRQLELLVALRSKAPVIALNDPFSPFSGRWREAFAEKLLKEASENSRIVVCTNVSFLPQCWVGNPLVTFVDIGKIVTETLEKMLLEVQKKKEEKAKEIQAQTLEKRKVSEKENTSSGDETSKALEDMLPKPLSFAYRQTRDFIFEPLAEFSTYIRDNHMIIGTLSFALVIALVSVGLFPNLAAQRDKLREIAAKFNLVNPPVVQPVQKVKTEDLSFEEIFPESTAEALPGKEEGAGLFLTFDDVFGVWAGEESHWFTDANECLGAIENS